MATDRKVCEGPQPTSSYVRSCTRKLIMDSVISSGGSITSYLFSVLVNKTQDRRPSTMTLESGELDTMIYDTVVVVPYNSVHAEIQSEDESPSMIERSQLM